MLESNNLVHQSLVCLMGLSACVDGVSAHGAADPGPDASVDANTPSRMVVTAVTPTVVDPLGGSHLVLTGTGFTGVTTVSIGGVAASDVLVVSDTQITLISPVIDSGVGLDVQLTRGETTAVLEGAVDAWSPAEIEGARLFDANSGVDGDESATTYEWQRLTENIGDDWRWRDGNTLSWLPSTNKFWMVGGWNYMMMPEGFDPGTPGSLPVTTTSEVWSSPDGVDWTLELDATNTQFERRHAHNVVLWNDKLWMLGGDNHQGHDNHDVVSSSNGVTWTVELGTGEGQTPPPWHSRVLMMAGVYDNKLWAAGGQQLSGSDEDNVIYNDVWSSADGVHWDQVADNAPASETRWAPCGGMTQLAEFRGEMWLVGCAAYRGVLGHLTYNDVWSTTDGVTWTKHAQPPWNGKIFHNVLVWDDKLWVIAGYSHGGKNGWPAGNTSETWYSEDGETWTPMALDRLTVPASHAQGVAARSDGIYYAGGNYSIFATDSAQFDKSSWKLAAFRGTAVRSWTDRGNDGLSVSPLHSEFPPVRDPNGLGDGIAGLQFDGSATVLQMDPAQADIQPEGRSIFWVARAPFVRTPFEWDDTYNPAGTIVGGPTEAGGYYPYGSAGLTDGRVVYTNREPEPDEFGSPTWSVTRAGTDLQHNAGQIRFAGISHALDGTVQGWVDGAAADEPGHGVYNPNLGWSRIGGGMADDGPTAVDNRFAGTLGAVIIVPSAVDGATVERMHQWAMGRFNAL